MSFAINRSVVTFHFTLRDPSGRVLDTSVGAAPVTYLEGAVQIIDGLDERMRGAAVGLKSRVFVPAAKAYGERDPAQVQPVKRALTYSEPRPKPSFQAGRL